MLRISIVAVLMMALVSGRVAPDGATRKAAAVAPEGYAARATLQWLSFQDAQTRLRGEPRVIIMDIYTDWCYWCKVMDKNTYEDRAVAAYLQEKFYPVRFNAETRTSVSWRGKSYDFNPGYKVNDLAISLTSGKLAYPTIVIITPDDHAPTYLTGYRKPADLEPVLKYFGEGAYKTQSYRDFSKHFQPTWR